jgi:hypothetical protein
MPSCEEAIFRGRRCFTLSNGAIEVTLLPGGGHVASMRLAGSSLNPLWEPPWPGIEPQDYDFASHPQYGQAEGRLLASLAGHFLCLDHFGELSAAEIAAGGYFHGEAPNLPWEVLEKGYNEYCAWLSYGLNLPEAGLRFQRRVTLKSSGTTVWFEEDVTNLHRRDVPLVYQQHVTLGPPFLLGGATRVDLPGGPGRTFPRAQGPSDRLHADRDFVWPLGPGVTSELPLNVFPSGDPSCSLCAVLLAPHLEEAFVAVSNPGAGLLIGYIFPRKVFPWVALWEENRATTDAPYLGRTVAWGIEFGSTPLPVTRMENLCAGPLFGQPRFLMLPAASSMRTQYRSFLLTLPPDWGGVESARSTRDGIVVRERGSSRTFLVPSPNERTDASIF